MLHYNILKNKNALITGVTGGVGENIATELLKKGCNVFVTGRNDLKLKKIVKKLKKINNCVYYKNCDLSVNSNVISLINDVKDVFSNIDILVNAAGIFPVKLFADTNLNDYNECMNVNLTTPFFLTNEFCKDMIKNKWGRVINIASSSAYAGASKTSVYCTSKHALLGMSRSIHNEFKHDNVRVLCVSPGSIKTEMGRKVEQLGQDYNTFIDPKELAEYIVYVSCFDKEMVSEEIRLNRLLIK